MIFILILVATYCFWKLDKKKEIIRLGIFSLPLAFIVAKILSIIYYNPRPFVVGNFTPLVNHVADNGFPSDHLLLAGTLASLVTIFNHKVGLIFWTLTIFIAISRVYVGVHHLVDVLASMLISIIVTVVVYFLNQKWSQSAVKIVS